MMAPKGFPSVTGEQECDTSLPLALPSPPVESAGSVVCNLFTSNSLGNCQHGGERWIDSVPPDAIHQVKYTSQTSEAVCHISG